MADALGEIDLKDRRSFNNWTTHTIRYNDQDPLGHVNNAVYSTFLEAGRTALIKPMLDAVKHPTLDFVLARVTINFVKELHYPGSADIGSRVSRLGTKSMTFCHGIFKGGTDECVATADAILVFFDLDKRHSIEPPAELRRLIEESMKS